MKRAITIGLVTLVLSGCASTPPSSAVVAYPAKGQTVEQQQRDRTECEAWARQQSGYDPATETAKGAGVGALLGAIGGAATGAAIGAATGNAGRGAAVGAVAGGVGGAAVGGGYKYTRTRDGHDRAYAACMTGRGYSVR